MADYDPDRVCPLLGTLIWTKKTPTRPGWYWAHLYKFSHSEPFPVKLVEVSGAIRIAGELTEASDLLAEWYGPISAPSLILCRPATPATDLPVVVGGEQ